MKEPYEEFANLLRQVVPVTPADEALIEHCIETVAYPRETTVVEMGKVAHYLFFVNSGFARGYHFEEGTVSC